MRYVLDHSFSNILTFNNPGTYDYEFRRAVRDTDIYDAAKSAGILFVTKIAGHAYVLLQVLFTMDLSMSIQKRAKSGGGYWNMIGGRRDPGEHPIVTAFREFYEEAGAKNPVNVCEITDSMELVMVKPADYLGIIIYVSTDYARYLNLKESNGAGEVSEEDVAQDEPIRQEGLYLSKGYR